jgi:hypothetical protein
MTMPKRTIGFLVEEQDKAGAGVEYAERHEVHAERYRVQAQVGWRRAVQTTFPDTHRYRDRATALREQAARTIFSEIRARLLAIAQEYDGMADFIEQAMRRRPFGAGGTLTRSSRKLRPRILRKLK